jgi:L-fuculose-phosphate aldolase
MGPMDPREAIVAAGARLGRRGLIAAGEGNLSTRLDDATLLVTPSGRRKDELAPWDLVEVPLDPGSGEDRPDAPRPSSDIAIHRAIYRARPDVTAIAHAHLVSTMALSLVGETPDPSVLPETALLLPVLPIVPYGAPGSEALARRIAATFALSTEPIPQAVILERHGAIAVGSALAQAVDRLELVDVLCRTWRDARLLAPDRPPLPPATT